MLVPLTSLAAASVSAWLVPPYLMLMTWLVLSERRANGPDPAGSTSGGETPHGAGPRADSEAAGPAMPPGPETAGEADAGTDAPPDGTTTGTKRGRARVKGKAKAVTEPSREPPRVTWVRVGPGKFVRVEDVPPPQADPSEAGELAGLPVLAATSAESPGEPPLIEGEFGPGLGRPAESAEEPEPAQGEGGDPVGSAPPADQTRPGAVGDETAATREEGDRGEGPGPVDSLPEQAPPNGEAVRVVPAQGEIPASAEWPASSPGDATWDEIDEADPVSGAEVEEGRWDGTDRGPTPPTEFVESDEDGASVVEPAGETRPDAIDPAPSEDETTREAAADAPEPPVAEAGWQEHHDEHHESAWPDRTEDLPARDRVVEPGPVVVEAGTEEPGGESNAGETGNTPTAPAPEATFEFLAVTASHDPVGEAGAPSPRPDRSPSRPPGRRPGRSRGARPTRVRRTARAAGLRRPRPGRGAGRYRRIARPSAPRAPPGHRAGRGGE